MAALAGVSEVLLSKVIRGRIKASKVLIEQVNGILNCKGEK